MKKKRTDYVQLHLKFSTNFFVRSFTFYLIEVDIRIVISHDITGSE